MNAVVAVLDVDALPEVLAEVVEEPNVAVVAVVVVVALPVVPDTSGAGVKKIRQPWKTVAPVNVPTGKVREPVLPELLNVLATTMLAGF